jgi:16S rRNA (cytosine1402-N4)-methyltransferase
VTIHIPVLPAEVLDGMQPKPGQTVVDGTLGGGGHAKMLMDRVGPEGHLIGLDRDPLAIEDTQARISQDNATMIASNYANLPEILDELEIENVDSILLDLGLSSDQLAARDRGFSFNSDGFLDLRFNMMQGEPASKLVNRMGEKHLADLLYQFGEEKLSRRIARKIVKYRHETKIETADHLARIVRSCYPRNSKQRIDPATRTFQALRIYVNEELKWLENALRRFPDCLSPGGRLAVISFHSLEDRMVKHAFVKDARLKVVTVKPIMAGEQELDENPRSRSAKLRVAERI